MTPSALAGFRSGAQDAICSAYGPLMDPSLMIHNPPSSFPLKLYHPLGRDVLATFYDQEYAKGYLHGVNAVKAHRNTSVATLERAYAVGHPDLFRRKKRQHIIPKATVQVTNIEV